MTEDLKKKTVYSNQTQVFPMFVFQEPEALAVRGLLLSKIAF